MPKFPSTAKWPITPGKHRPANNTVTKKRQADRDAVKRYNRKRFRDQKKTDKVSQANQIALAAKGDLKEIRELAKTLRPFLENGAMLLGDAWDSLVADQITVALTGTQVRMILDEEGFPIPGDDGKPMFNSVNVDPKTQIRVRQQLIEFFPKLIPEDTSRPDTDPLEVLLRRMNSEGGRIAIEVDGEDDPNEPGEEVVDAVGRIIDDADAAGIDLATENA